MATCQMKNTRRDPDRVSVNEDQIQGASLDTLDTVWGVENWGFLVKYGPMS